MKKQLANFFQITTATLLLGGNFFIGHAGAVPAANTVYLSPSSSSVDNGDTVSVSIWVNPATAASGGYDGIDGVDTTVNFNSAQLQYVSVDAAGSAFGTSLLQSAGGNSVRIARALGAGESFVTTNVLVAKVNLKAVAGSGSAAVTLSNTNTTHGSPYTNPATQNTNVTLTTAAAPTCPAGQTGTPPNCTTPAAGGGTGSTGTGSSAGGSTTPGTTTPTSGTKNNTSTGGTKSSSNGTSTTPAANDPVVASVASQDIQYTTASFTASSQTPTQAYIQFGVTKDGLSQQTQPDQFSTSHTLSIDQTLLIPGETYYYTIVSKDQTGKVTQTEVKSFTTKGLTLTIVIFDKDHKPLANKKLTLHSTPQTVTTNDQGVATFTNVIPGDHEAVYTDGDKTYKQAISVPNNVKVVDGVQTSATQNFSVVYSGYKQGTVSPAVLVIFPLLIVVAAVGWILFVKPRNKLGPTTISLASASPVPAQVMSAPYGASHDDASAGAALIDKVPGVNKPQPGSTIAPNHSSNPQDFTGPGGQ